MAKKREDASATPAVAVAVRAASLELVPLPPPFLTENETAGYTRRAGISHRLIYQPEPVDPRADRRDFSCAVPENQIVAGGKA